VKLRHTESARAHISRIHDYINERNPVAAGRVVARIRRAAEQLIEHPGMGRTGTVPGTREWVVRGLPYIVVYEVRAERDEIVVLGVYHGAQTRPGLGAAEP
jgi:addiction module RelE/StbE family toxin